MSKKKNIESHLSPAASVLQGLLQGGKSPLAEQFVRWRLWKDWETVLGKEIAKATMPVGYLDGTLYIWVKSAPRLQELTFLVRPILAKINKYAGRKWARSIRFTLDRRTVPQIQDATDEVKSYLNEDKTSPFDEIK